ncbi:potassium channel family protein [Aspergillus ibericus CBS 121593]|uniref:Putative potassium channel n=1 Tax=Aspergillus ibericus CBS 121593 TaxID=1448316 RepID=A0A395H2M4_9EURO|nr:putative potassium channel [Aspergillus ibericus CBS 121593]RAL01870.1 putative potassium channel [Aspergillus ibericus CBS 121593]
MNEDKVEPRSTEKKSLGKWVQSHFHPRPADDDGPQDWWVASTAIPLIAATSAPLANLMSIIALVMPWKSKLLGRTDSSGAQVQELMRDPRWCIALNATSLACGIAGNIFLLFNFTRTMRYIIALPASIILWCLSTAILIGITAATHIYDSPVPPDETYSQAYWSAVIAAALYFLLTVILMINMWGYVRGHYPQYFALTDGQRTLILQTTAFVVWLLIGAAIFHAVIDISFADALYFSDVTILTLGYGDITPPTSVGKGLVFPYAVMGIIILGLVVGSIHDFARELQYDNVVRKHVERKRQATIQHSISLEPGSEAPHLDFTPKNLRKSGKRSTIDAFSLVGRPKVLIMREEKDRFDAMRAIQYETVLFRRWYNLVLSLIMFGIVWTCGAVVFWKLEDITYFDALYFGFCSLLTIGYGDFTPTTNASRPFFIVWSLISIPTMTVLISEMSDTIVLAFKHATSVFADWTVLPHSGKYRKFLRRFPTIYAALQRREEKRRVAQGFHVGVDDAENGTSHPHNSSEHPPARSIEELASEPDTASGNASGAASSGFQLAQQLAYAIQRTTKDVVAGDPKRYSYEEWVAFTRLIRFTDPSPDRVEIHEDDYGILNWDWIGKTSPMLATETEPEWVLNRLCESLIRYIDIQARNASTTRDEDEPTLRKQREIRFEDE